MNQSHEKSNDTKQFQVGRLFVKQQSFTADTPTVFKELEVQSKERGEFIKPDNKMELKIEIHDLKESHLYEVVLQLKMIAKQKDLELYTASTTQSGVFVVSNYTDEERETLLNGYAVSVLYPYASQTLMTMINQGGFVALPLPPINFDALYQQKKEKNNEQKKPTEEVIPIEGELVH